MCFALYDLYTGGVHCRLRVRIHFRTFRKHRLGLRNPSGCAVLGAALNLLPKLDSPCDLSALRAQNIDHLAHVK